MFMLLIPPGALDEDTEISITALPRQELEDGYGEIAPLVEPPYRFEPSGLERSLLALALMRSDDPEGAREIAKHLEAEAEASPVAQAILDALGRGEDDGADKGEESTESGDEPATQLAVVSSSAASIIATLGEETPAQARWSRPALARDRLRTARRKGRIAR